MNEAELLGRVLMVAPPDGWIDGSQDWLDDLQPAGVILFRRNLPPDLGAVRRGIARLHAWAAGRGTTCLVAMDEEGGFVSQIAPYLPVPPTARALAWGGTPDDAREAFVRHGRRLRDLGVNLDFAPVCDVNNNPRNPVIGARAFGGEPRDVLRYARAVHDGLTSAGVLSCAKHFPGHGDTDVDSHLALPVVRHDRARFEAVELVPFRDLAPHVPSVMVAHLACPTIGDGELPATLSPRLATDLLRREVGFEGCAITDSMDMQGVSGQFGPEEAAVRAMLSGCDLLLYCFDLDLPRAARAGLQAALASGRLPRARLEQAAARVGALQQRARQGPPPIAPDAPLPAPGDDADWYRALCGRAMHVEPESAWRACLSTARAKRHVRLASANAEVAGQLARRLEARGWGVACTSEADVHGGAMVVLAERRPLAADRVAALRGGAAGAALLNLLTPEIDAPISEVFACVVRTADHSDAMLDVLAAEIAGGAA